MRERLRLAVLATLSLTAFRSLEAHSMYQSAVLLDFSGTDVHAELQLPVERVEQVLDRSITEQSLPQQESEIEAYVLTRIAASTPSKQGFTPKLDAPLAIRKIDGAPYVVVKLHLEPPPDVQANLFVLEDNVLLDRIPSQVALVSIRSDWRSSTFANDPQLVGVLHGATRTVTIDRTLGNWSTGFQSIFHLGIRHIAEGTDHLLFLLALLLPAPLCFQMHRWSEPAGVRSALWKITRVVTAFTIGHSITLAVAALNLVHAPQRPIEVLIAVSILVSAVHAIRPIFPGREAFIAAAFGLVHGLAFATTISELGLRSWERLASIFAFNLGIESMQLVVVLATLPSLLLLSRTPAYTGLRVVAASAAGVAAIGWTAERFLQLHTPVDMLINGVADHSVVLAAVLFSFSFIGWMANRFPGRPAPYFNSKSTVEPNA